MTVKQRLPFGTPPSHFQTGNDKKNASIIIFQIPHPSRVQNTVLKKWFVSTRFLAVQTGLGLGWFWGDKVWEEERE